MHSGLRLQTRRTPEYLQGPAARWDVDPEDASQIDDEDEPSCSTGLVNVPLDGINLQLQGDTEDETEASEAQAFLDGLQAEDMNYEYYTLLSSAFMLVLALSQRLMFTVFVVFSLLGIMICHLALALVTVLFWAFFHLDYSIGIYYRVMMCVIHFAGLDILKFNMDMEYGLVVISILHFQCYNLQLTMVFKIEI